MTITTLEYIHGLLLDDKRTREGMKNYAFEGLCKAKEKYQDKSISKAKYEEAVKTYDKQYDLYTKARDALHDFESHEF